MIEAEIMMEKARGLDDGESINSQLKFQQFQPFIHKTGSQ